MSLHKGRRAGQSAGGSCGRTQRALRASLCAPLHAQLAAPPEELNPSLAKHPTWYLTQRAVFR